MDSALNNEKSRVLFISQEIIPYLEQSVMGTVCRYLPQGTQERNKEIRTFMPKFGLINERRNQLHEVIRLSGMNLIINDIDMKSLKIFFYSRAIIEDSFVGPVPNAGVELAYYFSDKNQEKMCSYWTTIPEERK